MGKEKKSDKEKSDKKKSDKKDGGPLQAAPSPMPTINTLTNAKAEMVLWRMTTLIWATTAKTEAMVNTDRATLAIVIPT